MTILNELAVGIVADRQESQTPAVSERLDLHILDTAGALIAAHATTEGRRLCSLAQPSETKVPLLTSSPLDRAALTVALVRLTEVDDIEITSCVTPAAVAIASVAAMARDLGSPPALARAAVVSGYRIMIAFGRSLGGHRLLQNGFWPTYAVAPLGAAAATSSLLQLDSQETTHALALALAQTAASPGGPSEPNPRWLLLGMAARQGIAAALAARSGLTGDPALLDSDWLTRCHGLDLRPDALACDQDVVLEVSMKPHAAAKQSMTATSAFTSLLREVAADDIASVRAHVQPSHHRMLAHARVTASRSARFTSLPHLLALSAYAPDALFDVERGLVDNPKIASLRDRISVVADPALDEGAESIWPARVEITDGRGKLYSQLESSAPGDPARPLILDDVATKLHRIAKASGETVSTEALAAGHSLMDPFGLADTVRTRLDVMR